MARGAELSPGFICSMIGALARQGFVGDRFVLHMPHRHLITGPLDVPPRSSGAPLDLICRNELARIHRVEPAEIECSWWELPSPAPGAGMAGSSALRDGDQAGGGAQVLAIGCRARDAEGLVVLFDAAGAEVVAIDARGPALARAAQAVLPASPAMGAIVEWEWDLALVVIVRDQTIVYERVLAESGLTALEASLTRKLGFDSEVARHVLTGVGLGPVPEALAEDSDLIGQAQRLVAEHLDSLALELRASAAYASRRYGGPVSSAILCGDGAAVPGAAERIARHLDLSLRTFDPAAMFPRIEQAAASGMNNDGPAMAAAMGLAAYPEEALA